MSILKDRAEALRRCASQLEQIDAEIEKAVASIPSPLVIGTIALIGKDGVVKFTCASLAALALEIGPGKMYSY